MLSKKTPVLVILAIVLFAGPTSPGTPAQAAAPDFVRVFLTMPGRSSAADSAAVQSAGGRVRRIFASSTTMSADVPQSALAGLRHNPRFIDVRPVPAITAAEDQLVWGVDRVEADRTWGGAQ